MQKKNNKQTDSNKKITFVCSIIVVIIAAICIVVTLIIKKNPEIIKKKKEENNSYVTAAKSYFKDTDTTITSIKALRENGYEVDKEADECSIIELKKEKIEITGSNCKKAESLAKNPVIVVESSDGFKINEWNKKGSTLSIKLQNGGNSSYKEKDITKIEYVYNDTNITENNNSLVILNQNINTRVTVSIELKDGEAFVEKSFDIMVDVDKPVLTEKVIDSNIHALYEDYSGTNTVKYYLDEKNNSPSKEDMKSLKKFETECNIDYHVWSYAIDMAGNESNIEYLGTYNKNCTSVRYSSDESKAPIEGEE